MIAPLLRLRLGLGRSIRWSSAAGLTRTAIERRAELWTVTGEDAYIAADLGEGPLPPGHYAIRLRTSARPDDFQSPTLRPDYGRGFNAEDAIPLRFRCARTGGLIAGFTLHRATSGLRFAPDPKSPSIEVRDFRLLPRSHLVHYGGLAVEAVRARAHDPRRLMRLLQRGARHLLRGDLRQIAAELRSSEQAARSYDYWIATFDSPTADDLARLRRKHARAGLEFSILLPVYNPPPRMLAAAIDSVLEQTYANWELCIADDASTAPEIRQCLEQYAARDARIKVVYRHENGHISRASNSALEIATGDWVALLDHDDVLAPYALSALADAIADHPDAALAYSDEDKLDPEEQRCSPYFKSDWNYDLFLSHNMVCHLAAYRADRLRSIGGFRTGFEGAQDYDLALRFIEGLDPRQIVHVPHVLYHWRIHAGSTASAHDAKNYATLAARRAIEEHLARSAIAARVEDAPEMPGTHQVVYDLDESNCHTTIIIPTRNGLSLLRAALKSIFELTRFPSYDVLIVDNGSDDPDTLAYLRRLEGHSPRPVRIIRDDRPFNYSALNNAAVAAAAGPFVTLLNNDVRVLSPGWLRDMVSHAQRPGVGCVGARLWYPDMTLQHGGVITGLGGVAGHSHKYLPKGDPGYFGRAVLTTAYSAVTAACLTVSKQVFEAAGGLDEQLQVAFNDVDFCLRVRELGYRNVWVPSAELIHYESKTRGYETSPEKQARFSREIAYMSQRWGEKLRMDPFYSPNLTLDREDFGLSFPPRVQRPWRSWS